MEDVAHELGKKPGPQLARMLASIGYAWKALGAPQPPFKRVRSRYEMDPALAAVLVAAWQDLAHASARPGQAPGDRAGS